MKAHIWLFDIKDDILLIFFLLSSLLTSPHIKRLVGYLLLELVTDEKRKKRG